MAGSSPSDTRQPGLSVSMIVRNEARRLPGFLDALAGLADEVCITDTGSDDGTPDIAQSRGVPRAALFVVRRFCRRAQRRSPALHPPVDPESRRR